MAQLRGRPLVAYPLDALRGVCERVVVVARAGTALPEGVEVWTEPEDTPRHPLNGIVHALERAAGEDVFCVAADMPLLDPATLRTVAAAGVGLRAAAAPELEPLCAVYPRAVLDALRAAPPGAPLRATVAALDPLLVAVDPEAVVNVNTPDELARAATALDRRTCG